MGRLLNSKTGIAGDQLQSCTTFHTACSTALEKEIAHVRMLGFTGKFAIHPDQVHVVRQGFRPSDADIS